jgi:hypothetical protein
VSGRRSRRKDGQALVEFALVLPVFLLIVLGIAEFGFAFAHHITMEYATREGARMGAGLANGSATFDCNDVDDQVVAAVQRVLTASGSQLDVGRVGEIRIYKADANGQETGSANIWKPGKGPKVEGAHLLFEFSSGNWDPCTRSNAGLGLTDSIGVSLVYDYRYVTPLGSLTGLVGTPSLAMADRTVMALNPD